MRGLSILQYFLGVLFFVELVTLIFVVTSFGPGENESPGSERNKTAPIVEPLEVFQVQQPLRKSYEGSSCQQVVLQHDFAASYGSPYAGTYSPPENCNFTTTIFNLSITSTGINYDRLGFIFLGDIEIWRISTAMPVRTGIYSNFQKDMTVLDPLLREDQKIIMSLDSIFDSVFTGNFNVTITALYYNDHVTMTPAALILPISAQLSSKNKSSILSVPDGNASVSLTFPRNVERAIVSILASGNGAEEFWYAKIPAEYENTFRNVSTSGFGPFREVQLFIDGILTGVSWPFPIVFTGGLSPGLWVPIVGIDTYDVPNFEIDISPWLGILCDGKPHTFELKVVGHDQETTLGTVGLNWWVSGSVFLWIDEAGVQTTGTAVQSLFLPPFFQLTPRVIQGGEPNAVLFILLAASRSISHYSTITTSSGPRILSWSQALTYSNLQFVTAQGYNKSVSQSITGSSSFSPSTKSSSLITNSFSYPISFFQANVVPVNATVTNSTLVSTLERAKFSNSISILSHLTSPFKFHTHEVLSTRQNGTCTYYWNDTYYQFAGAIDPAEGTTGETEQWFSHVGPEGEYGRHVKAVDGYEPVLVLDETFDNATGIPPTEVIGTIERSKDTMEPKELR